ncbi:MAG: type IV secretory system conjugative DNA transfer family protein [Acidimicrobiales bacterium]
MADSLYLGAVPSGPAWAAPESHVLVLAPPRAGKTTSLVIPNVLVSEQPVVSTSTKPDVLEATLARRSALGRCWLFDPSGEVEVPPGVTPLRWSPVAASLSWRTAQRTAAVMGAAAHPARGLLDADHWTRRAEALLSTFLHAAALDGLSIEDVVRWTNLRDLAPAEAILARHGGGLPADVSRGLSTGDFREVSAAVSTAQTILGGYQTEEALAAARDVNFDPADFVASTDTVYLYASSRDQALVAPLVVGLIEQICTEAYTRSRSTDPGTRAAMLGRPVLLALDEVANIAPLSGLPEMLSEGGSQGLLILACIQDMGQAASRWGPGVAKQFFTLFASKLVLPGVSDPETLEAFSVLAGEIDVPVRSVSRTGPWWLSRGASTTTWSTRRQRRLSPADIRGGRGDEALHFEGGLAPARVRLTPYHEAWPWRELAGGPRAVERGRPGPLRPPLGRARERDGPGSGR